MLRPDGAHLFISRKLGALGLRKGLVERSLFLGGNLEGNLEGYVRSPARGLGVTNGDLT
jgi:hypothetical protein